MFLQLVAEGRFVSGFGQVIPARGAGIVNGFTLPGGAVDAPSKLNLLQIFPLDKLGIVFEPEFSGRVVAVFLEGVNLAGHAAEDGGGTGVLVRVAGELPLGVRCEEELGEVGGGELEADFGQLAGIGFPKELSEVILKQVGFEGALLFETPVTIASESFPIGDVALGDGEAVFGESPGDFGVRDVVAEHAIDHVAFEVREAGDLAVATEFPGWRRRFGVLVLDWIRGRRGWG